jgi:hypothetical protein
LRGIGGIDLSLLLACPLLVGLCCTYLYISVG